MISAFVKGFGVLSSARARGVVWRAIGVAVIVFAGLWVAVGYGLVSTALVTIGWIDTTLDALGGIATFVLTWFLFPAIITGVMSLMLDGVVEAVEDRHYPDLGPATGMGLGGNVLAAVRFLLVTVALNIVALPFILTPLYPFVFFGINGYLFGREYFEVVALRRMNGPAARHLRKRHRLAVFAAGALIAFLLTVPVVNLFAPVVAAAAMTHLIRPWLKELDTTVL